MPSHVADTADRRLAPKSGVASVVIVEMKEVAEGLPALSL
jgi:hypothetical protein